MIIEVKVKCFNPGCDINIKIDDPDIAVGTGLMLLTNEVIRLMENRELKKDLQNEVQNDLFAPSSGLTITTSDASSSEEIPF